MAKVSNELAKKLGATYDKNRKRIKKNHIKSNMGLLRADYHILLKTERTLLEDSLKLKGYGGIPTEKIKDLQQAFTHRRVPFTKSEINRDEKRRRDALAFIYRCREKAGVPVENKPKYDGELARVYSMALIAEIERGKNSKVKSSENQGDKENTEVQNVDGNLEDRQSEGEVVTADAAELEDLVDEIGRVGIHEQEVDMMSLEPDG